MTDAYWTLVTWVYLSPFTMREKRARAKENPGESPKIHKKARAERGLEQGCGVGAA